MTRMFGYDPVKQTVPCFKNNIPESVKTSLINFPKEKTFGEQFTNQKRFTRQYTNRKYADNGQHYSVETDSESDDNDASRKPTCCIQNDSVRKRNCKEWIKLERYDGSTSLDTYLAHFQNCNDYNGWNEADRIAHL